MSKFKQYIIVNRGLKMSRGKLMAQASHASMAWIMYKIKEQARYNTDGEGVNCDLWFPINIWENWIDGAFTKVVLCVDSEEELNDIINKLDNAGFIQASESIHKTPEPDFFVIRDNCLTELTPDETGTRMTCIGFKPTDDKGLQDILSKYKLFN